MDTPIYGELVDAARRRGSTVPDGSPESLTWAPDVPVSYGGYQDWSATRPLPVVTPVEVSC